MRFRCHRSAAIVADIALTAVDAIATAGITIDTGRADYPAASAIILARASDFACGAAGPGHSESYQRGAARRAQHPARGQQRPGRHQDAAEPPPQPPTNAAGGRQILPGLERRIVDIPPPTETRLIPDEVVVQIAGNVDRLQAAVARLGMTVIASESLTNSGSTVVRLRITNGKTPAAAIRSLANVGMAAIAQPNYVYSLDQAAAEQAPAARGDAGQQGDPAQYILEKLKMLDVHRMVRGANVPIAVIDFGNRRHPSRPYGRGGAAVQRGGRPGKAASSRHRHGRRHRRAAESSGHRAGRAPACRARLLQQRRQSREYHVQYPQRHRLGGGPRGARHQYELRRPEDPSLARALKLAYDRGIVLVAAAGNAGAKSPPLFPGADPFVIAVTATDVDDKLFTGANRGKYISVAAPGVDILVPAPESAYQLTTGTSVAAAEVSGIVALLLERNPKLAPADIRRILTASARRLAPGDRDDNFGSGLIDPLKALQLADPRMVTATPPPAPLRQR